MTGYWEAAQKKLIAFRQERSLPLLAIETSCDETAAAIVRGGREVVSSAVHSQIAIHQKYGGVVPELASRDHIKKLPEVVRAALSDAGLTFSDIAAVAVTAWPGLVGALITGVSYAKGLACALRIPLIGVNHIEGHVAANYISHSALTPPFTCLVASGGHSHIFQVEDYRRLRLIGATRDDAAGEAFDKIARALKLGYPGGPALEALALTGDDRAYTFPGGFNAGDGPDFSFSGLKTAVINIMHGHDQRGEEFSRADIAASFQRALIDVLVNKSVLAAIREKSDTLVLCGGVAANRTLAARMQEAARANGLRFFAPDPALCGDNAAMIGAAGYYALMDGQMSDLTLNAAARAEL